MSDTVVTPRRVQRRRVRGWRKPPSTVCVTRPSKFGNPFAQSYFSRAFAVRLFREWLNGADYLGHAERRRRILDDLPELRGLNLACYCPLDEPCHADVLLQLANPDPAASTGGAA